MQYVQPHSVDLFASDGLLKGTKRRKRKPNIRTSQATNTVGGSNLVYPDRRLDEVLHKFLLSRLASCFRKVVIPRTKVVAPKKWVSSKACLQ